MTNSPTGNTDPYVYPGTNVLKNLRDIRDRHLLPRFEMVVTTRRLTELENGASFHRWDSVHFQGIHRYIFQDVYTWAGEFRTVDIARSGQMCFARPEYILPCLEKLFAELADDLVFAGNANQADFCARAAYYMGEINAIHPFRDGNGRTHREFIRQFALKCGHTLNWSRVNRDAMSTASRKSFQEADISGLAAILGIAIDPFTAEA